MNPPHGFEFMDLKWLPQSLRGTLRDILECGNSKPFRSYYNWAARCVASTAEETGCTRIVELGAGTAPITRTLAAAIEKGEVRLPECRLTPCDLNPDQAGYRQLESTHSGLVEPEYKPVDFSRPGRRWPPDTLLILSATLHHIPAAERQAVLDHLTNSADAVLVFEPLRKTILSGLFCFLSLFPALLCPAFYLNRPQAGRRFLWCWLFPVAPLMFVWDGLVSCVRQWDQNEWLRNCRAANLQSVKETTFCQAITIRRATVSRTETQVPEFSEKSANMAVAQL